MNTLFPPDDIFPAGFRYVPEFLTVDEERALLELIAATELSSMKFHGYEAKRKIASFGYDWSFEKRVLVKSEEIPTAYGWLLRKVEVFMSLPSESIAELLITEYPAGSVINWHRDAPPFGMIIGISLLSNCDFKLRPYDKALQGRKNLLTLQLRARSLYVMDGEVRSNWEHSIAPVASTRFSITLRTLR